MCKCGKNYQYKSGIWRHQKQCIGENNANDNKSQITSELVMKLIEQNIELQQTLIEQNIELQQTLIEQNNTIIELVQKVITDNENF